MRIGFISYESPFDRSSFSGTLFYMYSALSAQKTHTITAIGHFKSLGFLEQKLYPKALRFCQSYLPAFAKQLAAFNKKHYIKRVQRAIDSNKYDLFVAPVSSDIVAALRLSDSAIKLQNSHSQKTHKRIIFITDATPGYIAKEYQLAANPKAYITEESCLKKSYKCLYSSRFMADMALDEFNKTPNIQQKIAVVRFGLNLDNPPQKKTTKGPLNHFNLVFVGKEWERKGGEIAVATAKALSSQGIQCHLTIIGCKPPLPLDNPLFTVIPFLNKNIASEQAKYHDIMRQAHCLLLPTRADCTPMVIAEANAFSCPALASSVGGVPSLINDGENGFLFPLTATAQDYANTIKNLLLNAKQYQQLSENSFMFYQKNLTWDAWAKNLLQHAQ